MISNITLRLSTWVKRKTVENGLSLVYIPKSLINPITGTQRVHIHCRLQFWHICFTPPSHSLALSLSFSVSLHLSPTNCPIYHSLPYPPHRSNSLKWKDRKGGKEGERERDEEGMREIDGGVCG